MKYSKYHSGQNDLQCDLAILKLAAEYIYVSVNILNIVTVRVLPYLCHYFLYSFYDFTL